MVVCILSFIKTMFKWKEYTEKSVQSTPKKLSRVKNESKQINSTTTAMILKIILCTGLTYNLHCVDTVIEL